MVGSVGGAAAIFEQQALEPAVVGLAHCRVNADVGGDAGQYEVGNAAQSQYQFEIGRAERTFAGLVDDRLAGKRGVSSGIISQPGSPRTRMRPQGSGSPIPAPIRRDRQRLFAGKVRPLPFASVENVEPEATHFRGHGGDRRDRRRVRARSYPLRST
jgi:hypothetical protein